MSKLSDHIDKTISTAILYFGKDLGVNTLNNFAAVKLGLGLQAYMRENSALHTLKQAASDIDSAEALRVELGESQKKHAKEIAAETGLDEDKISNLLGTMSMDNSKYQPNLADLKAQLFGNEAAAKLLGKQ